MDFATQSFAEQWEYRVPNPLGSRYPQWRRITALTEQGLKISSKVGQFRVIFRSINAALKLILDVSFETVTHTSCHER